jgi:hypothetical protein
LKRAGRHDHVRRLVGGVGRLDGIAGVYLSNRQHLDSRPEWGIEAIDVGVEILDDFVASEKAVRVVALVGEARKASQQVRRHQRERVPPLAAPALADPVTFEDDVVTAGVRQVVTRRQPRLPCADDDDVTVIGHCAIVRRFCCRPCR